jgi:two-component system, cell cycle response regulator CpdR
MPRAVLIVDDEPLFLSLTSAMLEDLGCEALSADSGADALAQLALDPRVGLLLTDIQMPGMSGYELAAEVRQHWPELRIAVMSGNDVGGHGYEVVRKPFHRRNWHTSLTLLGTKRVRRVCRSYSHSLSGHLLPLAASSRPRIASAKRQRPSQPWRL